MESNLGLGVYHVKKLWQEMIDHVEMLVEHLTNDDPKKRIKAAEAMSAYIADDVFLPEHMEVHPAQVLATLFFRSVPDRTLVKNGIGGE